MDLITGIRSPDIKLLLLSLLPVGHRLVGQLPLVGATGAPDIHLAAGSHYRRWQWCGRGARAVADGWGYASRQACGRGNSR